VTTFSISQPAKAQLLRNALFNSGSWGVTVLVNLAAIPLFLRYLGVEGYGIYLLLTGLFGYFGLLDFGLSDGVIKYVSHHYELEDYPAVTESLNAALLVQLIAGAVGVFLLCTFNRQIIQLLHVSSVLVGMATRGIYISAAGFFCKMLLNTFNAVLKGLQRFDMLAKTTIGFSLATTITAVCTLIAGGGLLQLVIVTAFMTVVNLATVVILVFRYVPHCRLTLRARREPVRALFSFGAYTFITRVAGALNSYFLQVVVAVILGAGAVAYFAVPLRLTTAMEAGLSSLVSVIFPYVSALNARGNLASLRKLYSYASKYVVALSAPPYLFVILFSRQILRIWLGYDFADKGWLVLSLLAGSSLLGIWTMVPANTVFGTGNTKIAAIFSSIVVGLNLLFSVLLTREMGIRGAALAVLISAAQGPVFIWYVTSRVVGVSPKRYFTRVFGFHVVPTLGFLLLSLVISWATAGEGKPAAWIALALGVTLTASYYSLLLGFRIISFQDLGWSG
jgi:O-antigen/teichoic acid export membrane protein